MRGPSQRPSQKPMLSPISAPTITTSARMTPSATEPTAVAATSTTVSPGTMRPTSTLVSSMMATPARMVRNTGSTLCTASSNHVRTSFTVQAYGAAL